MMGVLSGVVERVDTWMNAITGLGTALRDKTQGYNFVRGDNIDPSKLEDLYHKDDMSARVCDALPEEAMRKGVSFFSAEGDPSGDLADYILEESKRLKLNSKVIDAAVWGRTFGGGAIYVGIDDGRKEDQPVDMAKIAALTFLDVLDKRDLVPEKFYSDPFKPKFGEPETYRLNTALVATGTDGLNNFNPVIHADRLVIFGGARTTKRQKQVNNGWDDSVLEKVWQVLIQFNSSWQSTTHLLQDASQAVFKIKNLTSMIVSGDKDALHDRMEIVDIGRSVCRAIMVDADMEDFQREQFNFSGLPDVINAFVLRLAAAANMPVTVLMGQSPSGLNATGESDTRMWYDAVDKYRQRQLLDQITRLYTLLLAAASAPSKIEESWEVHFPPLLEISDKEDAETRKLIAEVDKVYVEIGVLLPAEVATSRFPRGRFDMTRTNIDLQTRKDLLKAELETAKAQLEAAKVLAESPSPDPQQDPAPQGDPGASAKE